jgi:hypothetical protein
MQVHLSRTKRKDSVHQAVRRRLDTPRVPERHGRKALQARHEHGKRKPRLPRDFFDDEALCAKLEIARARHLSRLAQAGRRAISRAEKRLLECATDADSKELREAQNFRVQLRTDLERAVLAGSYDDLIRIKQDCEELLVSLRQLLLDMKARELVESKDKGLVCPIGMELMRDPVVASDVNTYERRNIDQHFKTHDRRLVHGNFDEVSLSPLSASEFEAIHDIAPFTWRRTFHFAVSRIGSPDATKVRSPMTNLPLENLKLVPNLLVRSKIHQEVDAAKCLLQRPSTKAMGAEETQEFTHCKDEQDKLLAPMAKEHMLRKEVGFGLWRLVGDLLVKLQNAEEASKDGMAKLQEELNKLKAQLAEKDAVHAIQYKIIADLQKAAKDGKNRSSEQANELKMSHKKAPADKDTGLSKLKAQLGQAQAQVQQPQMQTTTDAGDFLRYTTVCM